MFGISNNVRSRVVRVCTPELFHQVVHSPLVGRICAEIADALEAMRRGEMAPEDFDTLKSERKKQLPIFTPHATFPGGRRLNSDAVPSGLSMYDVDHIPAPREFSASTWPHGFASWASCWPTSHLLPKDPACSLSSHRAWGWRKPSAGCRISWTTAPTTSA